MFRRHPYLTVIGLLTTLLLLGCGIFLATFDLNRYRESLQNSLSAALSRPVLLGEAHLSWHFGPSFDFARLEIGDRQGKPALLRVEKLYLKPKILPMLIGRISFYEIVLDSPRLSLDLSAKGTPPSAFLPTLLTTVQADSATVRDGNIVLLDGTGPEAPFRMELQQLQIRASHLFSESRGRLRLDAQLVQPGANAELKLRGRMALPAKAKQWIRGRYDLELNLLGLEPGPLAARYGPDFGMTKARGLLDTRLTLVGSPVEGLRVTTEVTGNGLALQFPELYSNPLTLQKIAFSGRWLVDSKVHTLDDISLNIDALRLNGHVTLQRSSSEPWLEGSIHTPEMDLQEIWRLLPDNLPFLSANLDRQFPSGKVRIAYARFAGPLSDFRRIGPALPLHEASLQARDCRLFLKEGVPAEQLSFKVALAGRTLSLSQGRGMLFGSPLQFSGRLENLFDADMKSTFGAAWILPANRLGELLPEGKSHGISGEGPIPVSLSLNGAGRVFETNLSADLEACWLNWAPLFEKQTGVPGKLEINATLSPDRLLLNHGRLNLGSAEVTFSGERQLEKKAESLPAARQPFELHGKLANTDLAEFSQMLPLLKKFRLRGQLAGHYDMKGEGFAIHQAGGSLTLKDLGVYFHDVLQGDLHGFSGQVRLFPDHIEWADCTGQLGDNPIRVSGKVGNWSSPQTELIFSADRLKASDLFFPSPTAQLKRLQGRLVFSSQDVLFDNIKVALGEEPAMNVKGRLEFHPAPFIHLDISAGQANIDQVVALWEGGEKGSSPTHQQIKVQVKARVGAGTYGPLTFHNAEGTVISSDEGLRIEPVNFNLDRGNCHGRILLFEEGNKPLLKISGHLENAAAEKLQSMVFPDRKSLLSGTVSGDFTLEGLAGDRFLETSEGVFGITVTEGVLYRFAFLSKVFSLLNVGQILTLNLPDMARKGMPFKKLEGSFSLQQGKLTTEDLFITSNAMNMSVVGTTDLVNQEMDLRVGVKPFGTVDTIVTHIPIAGWLLTGDEKALITAHFKITGKSDNPEVRAIPVTSLSSKVLGIFKRVLGLPGKAITDPEGLITGESSEPKPDTP
jgi:hypothetical protein